MPEDAAGWSTDDWVRKLRQQAEDSKEYRHRLYEKVGLRQAERILDVGCGTGAVTLDIAEYSDGSVMGIDIDEDKLEEARRALAHIPNVEFQNADVQELPFPDEAFDAVLFNIVLMYVPDKEKALREMARVTRPGGTVLATCEPDYEGQLCYPEDPFKPLMLENLSSIGADLDTGRRLKTLFTMAGLETEVGMDTDSEFVYQKDDARRLEMFREQFWVFEKAFQGAGWTDERIEEYRKERERLMEEGLSFSFMPLFYAIGKKT
jgi:SAM-dependent methyltransferase